MNRTKQLTWRDVRVGILVFLGLAIMIFMILIVGTNIMAFGTKYTLNTFVPNVVGLNPGAFVTIAGIKSGKIGDFRVAERDGELGIMISLFIQEEFQHKITASSVATIRTLGILGDKYVEVSLGKPDEPSLQDGDFVRASPPLDFEAMAGQAEEIVETLPKLLKSTHQLVESLQTSEGTFATLLKDSTVAVELQASLSGLADLTKSLNRRDGTLGKLMHTSTAHDQLVRITGDLEKIVKKIESGRGSIGRFVADTTLYANLSRASARSDSLMAKLNSDDGSAGKLLNDPAMHDGLTQLLQDLHVMMEDMKKYPQKYFQVKVF